MSKTVHLMIRGITALLVLIGLVWTAQPVSAQFSPIYRRPDQTRRTEPAEKPKKTQKSSRGGVIKPSTIKTTQETESSSEDSASESANSASDQTRGEVDKATVQKRKTSEWDKDENRALAKLQTRHKAKIILGRSKDPAYKVYLKEDGEYPNHALLELQRRALKKNPDAKAGEESEESENAMNGEEPEDPGAPEEEPPQDPGL